jgi:uncharacterized protein YndB with AHSA1/START domain
MNSEPSADNTPLVRQLPTGPDQVVITAAFPGVTPADLFAYWTEPERICRWWSAEAQIDARPGGAYHLAWPRMDRHLRGHYTRFEPGTRLTFTWAWDHEPALPTRTVALDFAPDGSRGTLLTVAHGAYGDSAAEQADRQSHIDGWLHFLPRLQGVFGDR